MNIAPIIRIMEASRHVEVVEELLVIPLFSHPHPTQFITSQSVALDLFMT